MDISEMMFKRPFSDAVKPLEKIAVDKIKNASGQAGQQMAKLEETAKQFEAIFVNQILKQMQETIKNASFDPEDSSNEQVHGMYCSFLGDSIAEKGGFGLWEKIYEQMAQMQGQDVSQQGDGGASQLNESV